MKCVSPAGKARRGDQHGAWSPGTACEGGWPDSALTTRVQPSQRKKTAEGNDKTARKTNGAEMIPWPGRVWSSSWQERQQPENNLIAGWTLSDAREGRAGMVW